MDFWGSCPQSYVHLRFRFWGHSWEWGGPGALGGPGNAITFSRSIHQVATGAKGSRPHITLERLFAQSVQCAAVCVFAEIPQKIWGQNRAALWRQRKMPMTVKKVCYNIGHSAQRWMIVNSNMSRMPLRTSKGPSMLDDCK